MKKYSPARRFSILEKENFIKIIIIIIAFASMNLTAHADACLPFYAQGEQFAWIKYSSVTGEYKSEL
jgi:hypothetical protein